MRKIILYIASSLDGYIADSNGSVAWLDEIPNPDKSDYGYAGFYDSIDTVLMGNKTYQQVLGFGIGNPYKGKKIYILTKNDSLTRDENAEYISINIPTFLEELKKQKGKNIWCVGGGEINALLLENYLMDEIKIFIMPVILGSGIPLATQLKSKINLKLINQATYQSGVVALDYLVKYK
jgi:dihydrofolate reductase